MSFSDNLRQVRTERHMTQEELAEKLGVSRQAVSKWESDQGYPETEKLLILTRELGISLDYLFNNETGSSEQKQEERSVVYASDGKIMIKAYNGSMYLCSSVNCSEVAYPGKGYPAFILSGVDKVGIFGPHNVILGFYEQKEVISKELDEIFAAIRKGEKTYELKYASEVELKGLFGVAKLKNKDK